MPKTFHCEKPELTEDESRYALGYWRDAEVPIRHRGRIHEKEGDWYEAKKTLIESLGVGSIIVLAGKRGSGKTQLSVEAIRSYCWARETSLYTKGMEVFMAIRAGMKEATEEKAITPFLRPNLLVIDAMEERGETEWENRTLNYLLDVRYDTMKDTILITNQTKERIAESLGLSIVSRIHESGKIIECNWDSFREKKNG